MTLSLQEYLRWRGEILALKCPGRVVQTPRGECSVFNQVMVRNEVVDDLHMQNFDIENAEFNLIYFGLDMDKDMKNRLYGDDEDLYNEYRSLNIRSLATNGKRRDSRKNIIFNKQCCLSWWQLHGDELYVVSRSLDLQRAGLSDVVLVNRIARQLGCTRWTFVGLINHVYTDRTKIARRKDK
jgi:hypothetical protein